MRRRNLAMLLAIALGITSVQMPVMAKENIELESGIVDSDIEAENAEDINGDTSAKLASDISSDNNAENMEAIDDDSLATDTVSKDSVSMDEISSDADTDIEAGAGISGIADPRIVSDSSMEAGQKVTYDCIWLGSYPQAEVVASKSNYTAIEAEYLSEGDLIEDASLYSKLQSATYNGSNETTINGTRYRRMKKGDATHSDSLSGYYSWSDSTTYHYFKYEPIKWRVIEKNSDNLFLLADKGIDDKGYNEADTSVTWETCSLRTYLNGAFYDKAFNATEKAMIKSSTVENADNLRYGTSGGNNTTDKVFLLSEKEVYKTDSSKSFSDSSAIRHGFVDSYSIYDEARMSLASTYARAMGTRWNTNSMYKGNAWWWLRSPGYSSLYATYVNSKGNVYNFGTNLNNYIGLVRPSLKINLSSLTDSMYAGTVCSDGTVNETAKPGGGGSVPTPTPIPGNSIGSGRFTIYENNKKASDSTNSYKQSSLATMTTASGDVKFSDSKGIIDVKNIAYPITVMSSGYIKRTITKSRAEKSKSIYLQKDENNTPVISGVWIDDIDVLNNDYYINMLSDKVTSFDVEVAWNGSSIKEIKLVQNGRSKSFTSEKFSTVLSDNFDASETIYIVATDTKGVSTKKPLKFSNVSNGKVPDILDGISFEKNDGNKFTLPDSIPFIGGMDMKFGNYSAIPVSFEVSDGKVYAAIGFDMAKYEWDSNSKDKDNGKIKGVVDNLKETFKEKDKKKFSEKWGKKINEYKKRLKVQKSSIAVDGDLNIMGFAEGVLPEDGNPLHIKWLDTGVVFNLSGSVSHSYPFVIWAIPCYVKGVLSGEVTARLNVALSEQAKNFVPLGTIDGKIELKIGAGIGFDGILNVEFGGKGALMPQWLIRLNEKDYFKIDGSANFYLKGQLLCWSKTHDFPKLKGTLWESDGGAAKGLLGENGSDIYIDAMQAMYDSDGYKCVDISYLDDVAEDEGATYAIGDATVIKDNIYHESEIQYVDMADGKRMAFFVNAADADYNHLALYYSIYNGSSWSSPKQVENDGTADFAPQAVSYNGDIYIVWQNLSKTFTDIDSLDVDDIAPYTDISVAKFNGSSFDVTDLSLTGFDAMPRISANDSGIVVAFVNKKDGKAFGTDSSIYVSEYKSGGFSVPSKKYSVEGRINSLDVNKKSSGADVAYVRVNEAADGTITNMLYENGIKVSTNSENVGSATYHNGSLYWLENGAVINKSMTSDVSTAAIGSDYELFDMDGRLAAVFSEQDDLRNSIYLSYYNEATGCWERPVVIHESEDTINAYDVLKNADGSFDIVYSSKKITGSDIHDNPYGSAKLMHNAVDGSVDILITDAYCDESLFVEDRTMSVYASLENKGIAAAENVSVVLVDGGDNELSSKTLSSNLIPGSSETVVLDFEVSDIEKQSELKIILKNNSVEADRKAISLKNDNLSVGNVTQGITGDDKLVIAADIINEGNDASKSVTVSLRRDSSEGEVIDTMMTESIEKGGYYVAAFEISDAKEGAYYVCIDDEDCNTGDNDGFVYYGVVGEGAPSGTPTNAPSGTPSGTPTNAPSGTPSDTPSNAPESVMLRKEVASYTIEYSKSVSYNAASHIENSGKASASKTTDITVKVYDSSGNLLTPDKYKVKFKNNKDTVATKGKQPYFTIALKGKTDSATKAAFKSAKFEFDIEPCDLSTLTLTPTIKTAKDDIKIAKLTYTNDAGKKISLKHVKNGKGDYSIVAEDDETITIKGIGNYTGTVVFSK